MVRLPGSAGADKEARPTPSSPDKAPPGEDQLGHYLVTGWGPLPLGGSSTTTTWATRARGSPAPIFDGLAGRIRDLLARDGFPPDQIILDRSIVMRYARQIHLLTVPVDDVWPFDSPLLEKTIDRFETSIGTGMDRTPASERRASNSSDFASEGPAGRSGRP
jgi:hypothetical protein